MIIPILFTLIITYYLTRLWYYMPAYYNIENLYNQVFFDFPDQFRARAHRIQNYIKNSMWFHAVVFSAMNIRWRHNDMLGHLYIGQAFMAFNIKGVAKEHLLKAKQNLIPGREEEIGGIIEQLLVDLETKDGVKERACNY